jgi:hypothetical protein
MRRDDVIARLKETEPALKAFGVAALYLFGSHARDEGRSDSGAIRTAAALMDGLTRTYSAAMVCFFFMFRSGC